MVFKATVTSITGEYMTQDEHLQDFCTFDSKVGLLFFDPPKFLVSASLQARERLVQALASVGFAASEQTPFIKERTALAQKASPHASDSDLHRGNLSFLWVSVANSMPAIFWTLHHLLRDRNAYDKCRAQIEQVLAKRPASSPAYYTLDELDSMTMVLSAFYETLRLRQVIFSARVVTQDFVYNPQDERQFLVEKGTRIMACPTMAHYDADIFPDPHSFQVDRFAPHADGTPKKYKGRPLSSYLRVFGGGGHLCSGRLFITYETQALLAMMLTQFDLRLVDDKEVVVDYSRQGIGVPPPTRDPLLEYRQKL